MHRLPPELLEHRIHVAVVGCGGTGSAILSGLPYLHQAMLALGHPTGLSVTAIDGDRVSASNCVRQPFGVGEIGHYKSTVLVNRLNLFWGFGWKAETGYLTARPQLDGFAIVIGCVDTRRARRTIAGAASGYSRVHYWLDVGNKAEDGNFVLGQPENEANKTTVSRLPTVAELYPETVDPSLDAADGPSCSALEALTKQGPFVNQVMAAHALALLGRLFRYGQLDVQGGFVNLATGKMFPIPVPPPAPTPIGARARRRARRQPA